MESVLLADSRHGALEQERARLVDQQAQLLDPVDIGSQPAPDTARNQASEADESMTGRDDDLDVLGLLAGIRNGSAGPSSAWIEGTLHE